LATFTSTNKKQELSASKKSVSPNATDSKEMTTASPQILDTKASLTTKKVSVRPHYNGMRDWTAGMDHVRDLHKTIQESIGEMQGKVRNILEMQAQSLRSTFKIQLTQAQQDLAKERKKSQSGSVEWVEKCHKLKSELEWLRETVQKLQEDNRNLNKELRKSRRTLRYKDEDREYLMKQLVAIKKENAVLAANRQNSGPAMPPAIARLEKQYSQSFQLHHSSRSRGNSRTMPSIARLSVDQDETALSSAGRSGRRSMLKSSPTNSSQEKRYRSIISKMKRQLEGEQNKVKKITGMYQAEISNRNELQKVLQQCVVDVRDESKNRANSRSKETKKNSSKESKNDASTYSISASSLPAASVKLDSKSLDSSDRRRVVDNLLRNDKIVYLLYERLFPNKNYENIGSDQLLKEMEVNISVENEPNRPWTGYIDTKLMNQAATSSEKLPSGKRTPSSKRGSRLLKV